MNIISQTVVGQFDHVVYAFERMEIDTLRPVGVSGDVEFRPAKVKDKDGRVLWQFDKSRHSGAYAWLREVDDEGPVIFYAGHRRVLEVIPVRDLPHRRPVRHANGHETHEGGRGVQALVELKLLIAEDFGFEPELTPVEVVIAEIVRKRERQAREVAAAQAQAQAAAAQAERERERQARVNALLARPTVSAYAADGQRLTGIPVVGDEWHMLPRHKWVISVDSFDSESEVAGQPIEHFQVQKSAGGRVEKAHLRPVTSVNPMQARPVATKRGDAIIELKGEIVPLPLYTRTDVDALHQSGLNGATRLGSFPVNADGTVTVYEVTKGGVREVARAKPMAIV